MTMADSCVGAVYGGSSSGGGGGGGFADGALSFIFQPGGVTTGNVFATWPALYTALSAADGVRIVLFDDTIVQPVPIPAGAYDFSNVLAYGMSNPGAGPTEVQFLDGALVSEFFSESHGISYATDATSAPTVSLGAGLHTVELSTSSITAAIGATQPFFEVAGAGAILALTLRQSQIQTGVTESIETTGGATTTINLFESSTLAASTLADDGASVTLVDFDASSTVSTVQPNATTPPVYTPVDEAPNVLYAPAVPGDWAVVPVDVAGALDELAATAGGGGFTPPGTVANAARWTTSRLGTDITYTGTDLSDSRGLLSRFVKVSGGYGIGLRTRVGTDESVFVFPMVGPRAPGLVTADFTGAGLGWYESTTGRNVTIIHQFLGGIGSGLRATFCSDLNAGGVAQLESGGMPLVGPYGLALRLRFLAGNLEAAWSVDGQTTWETFLQRTPVAAGFAGTPDEVGPCAVLNNDVTQSLISKYGLP